MSVNELEQVMGPVIKFCDKHSAVGKLLYINRAWVYKVTLGIREVVNVKDKDLGKCIEKASKECTLKMEWWHRGRDK